MKCSAVRIFRTDEHTPDTKRVVLVQLYFSIKKKCETKKNRRKSTFQRISGGVSLKLNVFFVLYFPLGGNMVDSLIENVQIVFCWV